MVGWRAVQLVRQCTKEAVAVADGVSSIEAKLTQLAIEQLTILFRVGYDRLVDISVNMWLLYDNDLAAHLALASRCARPHCDEISDRQPIHISKDIR